MKLAKFYTGKPGFIAMLRGFHGKTLGSLSLMGKSVFRQPLLPLLEGVRHVPFGDADAVEKALAAAKAVGDGIAAVVAEPSRGRPGPSYRPTTSGPGSGNCAITTGCSSSLTRSRRASGARAPSSAWTTGTWLRTSCASARPWAAAWCPCPPSSPRPRSGRSWNPIRSCTPPPRAETPWPAPRPWPRSRSLWAKTFRGRRRKGRLRAGESSGSSRPRFPQILQDVRGKGLLIGMEFPTERWASRWRRALQPRGPHRRNPHQRPDHPDRAGLEHLLRAAGRAL